jgi:hypothetical protein
MPAAEDRADFPDDRVPQSPRGDRVVTERGKA